MRKSSFRFEHVNVIRARHGLAPTVVLDEQALARVQRVLDGTHRRSREASLSAGSKPVPDPRGDEIMEWNLLHSSRWGYQRPTRPFDGWMHDQAKADAFAATKGEPLASLIRKTPEHYRMIAEQEALTKKENEIAVFIFS